MDLVQILNSMHPDAAESFMALDAEERELVYTRGIMANVLETEFNKKGKQKDIIFMIQNDPHLHNIKNIKCPKVILKAALNNIYEMKSIQEIRDFLDYLDVTATEDYQVNSADNCFKKSLVDV